MAEAKFTPGPWEVFKCTASDGEIYVRIQTEHDVVENGENIGPETICTIGGYPTIPRDGGAEWEATGNLIAAAPDMYEALEAYDKAEADILENANWYTESGVPQITQEQFDRLVDCQTLKAKALRKARGEE